MKGHGQKSELELQEKLDQVLCRMESLELRFESGRRATVNYRCYSSNREGHIRPFASASQVQGRGQRRTGNDTEIDESVRGYGEWNKAPFQVCGCNLSYTTMCRCSLPAILWRHRSLTLHICGYENQAIRSLLMCGRLY